MNKLFGVALLACLAPLCQAALTLQFANKWNLAPTTMVSQGVAIQPGAPGFSISVAYNGNDFQLQRIDRWGNTYGMVTYDQPLGGGESDFLAKTDPAGNLYLAYRTNRARNEIRVAKFSPTLAFQWDSIAILNPGVQANHLEVDATGAYVAGYDSTNAFVSKMSSDGQQGFALLIDNGPRDLVHCMNVKGSILAVGTGSGAKPRMYLVNKTNGSNFAVITPTSLALSDSSTARYEDIIVKNSGDIYAVGQGVSNGAKSFATRVTTEGTGEIHTLIDDYVDSHLAEFSTSGSTAYLLQHHAANSAIRVRYVSTNSGNTLLEVQFPGTNATAIETSTDTTRIGVLYENENDVNRPVVAEFTNSLTTVVSRYADPGEQLLRLTRSPDPKSFQAVGYLINTFPGEQRIRQFGTSSTFWTINYAFAGYLTQSPIKFIEDASGSRYILCQTSGRLEGFIAGTLLKTNAAGVVQWAKTLATPEGGFLIPTDLVLSPDGSVTTVGYGGSNLAAFAQVQRWSPSGVSLATKTYSYSNRQTLMTELKAGSDGSIYGFGAVKFTGDTNDMLVVKFSASLVPLWTRVMDGNATNDLAYAGAVLANGSVAVAVGQQGTPSTAVVRVFSSAGVPLWTQSLPDSGGASPGSMKMLKEPGGGLALGVAYEAPNRHIIKLWRLNPITKTVVMSSVLGALPYPQFDIAPTPAGHLAIALRGSERHSPRPGQRCHRGRLVQ